ncbi:MAG: DUF1493 family protein [Caulobacteraceae bacterium]
MDEALDEIRRLVAKFVWRRAVLPESRLWHDLHIGPEDAWELLGEVTDKFGTSFESMSFLTYFPDQPDAWGAGLGMMLGFRSDKRPFTVQHLANVVKRGDWFDPPDV